MTEMKRITKTDPTGGDKTRLSRITWQDRIDKLEQKIGRIMTEMKRKTKTDPTGGDRTRLPRCKRDLKKEMDVLTTLLYE